MINRLVSLTGQHFLLGLVEGFGGVKVPPQKRRKKPRIIDIKSDFIRVQGQVRLCCNFDGEILTALIVTSGCDSSRHHRYAAPFSLRSMLLDQLATDNSQIRSENAPQKSVTRSSHFRH